MKFQDIPVNIITVRIKRSDNVEALQEQPVFSVEASLSRADEFEIRLRRGCFRSSCRGWLTSAASTLNLPVGVPCLHNLKTLPPMAASS